MKGTQYVARQPDESGFIHYSDSEHQVWNTLITRQMKVLEGRACQEYFDGIEQLRLPHERIPQLGEINQVLGASTGWSVAQVPALIPFQTFFELLASKRFPVATFIRTPEELDYLQEPDIFHEIFGHTPLLTDPAFAGFSRAIGEAGTRAAKEDYAWLIRLYWFTIEFGLLREAGGLKALGSGLASSVTELPWSLSAGPEHRPFEVIDILRTPYRIDIHQPVYFVLDATSDLFAAAERDLLADVAAARAMGLHDPKYPPKAA